VVVMVDISGVLLGGWPPGPGGALRGHRNRRVRDDRASRSAGGGVRPGPEAVSCGQPHPRGVG